MLMEKSIVENGFIIDLSTAQNTSQLVFELSSIMEHPDVKGKSICLKLGSMDLKQSQLLSIKALIESMDATIAFIDTLSEQTEASAVSLGVQTGKVNSEMPVLQKPDSENLENMMKQETVMIKTEAAESDSSGEDNKTVEIHAEMNNLSSPIATTDGIEDIYDELQWVEEYKKIYEFNLKNKTPIEQIYLSDTHTLLINNIGNIFLFGMNDKGQCGLNNKNSKIYYISAKDFLNNYQNI